MGLFMNKNMKIINKFNHLSNFLQKKNFPSFTKDGSGYVEDGREIFDDDEDAEDEPASKNKSKKKETKKKLRDVNKPANSNGSIRSLFSNAVPKKKDPSVKVEDDDILAGILGEINPTASSKENGATTSKATPSSTKVTERANEKSEMEKVKEYMQNFTKNIQKKPETKSLNTSDDVRFSSLWKICCFCSRKINYFTIYLCCSVGNARKNLEARKEDRYSHSKGG